MWRPISILDHGGPNQSTPPFGIQLLHIKPPFFSLKTFNKIFGGRIPSWYSSARLYGPDSSLPPPPLPSSHPQTLPCPNPLSRRNQGPTGRHTALQDTSKVLQKVPPHAEVDPTMPHCHRWGVAVDHLQGLFRDNRPCRFP